MLGSLAIASLLFAAADDNASDDVAARFHLLRGMGDLEGAWKVLFETFSLSEAPAAHKILEGVGREAAASPDLDTLAGRMRELAVAVRVARWFFVDPIRGNHEDCYTIPHAFVNGAMSFYGNAGFWFRIGSIVRPVEGAELDYRLASIPMLHPYGKIEVRRKLQQPWKRRFYLPGEEVFRHKPMGTIETELWSWDDDRVLVDAELGDRFVVLPRLGWEQPYAHSSR